MSKQDPRTRFRRARIEYFVQSAAKRPCSGKWTGCEHCWAVFVLRPARKRAK